MKLMPIAEGSRLLFDIDAVKDAARKKHARRIGLQLPEGIRIFAAGLADLICNSTGSEVFVDASPCFGACDVPVHLFGQCDLVIQFGHTEMPSLGAMPKMHFANLYLDVDPTSVIDKALPMLRGRTALLTTAQHVHQVDMIHALLHQRGVETVEPAGDARLSFPCQLLGCDYTSALSVEERTDTFLFYGEGIFHPLGLSILRDKRIILANPVDCTVRSMEEIRERVMRQRFAAIATAMKMKSFGILVSRKLGQRRTQLAEKLMKEVREAGRQATLITTDVISPPLLDSYSVEAFVSTACPRVAIDDYDAYTKPLLTPVEAEIAIGVRESAEFTFDQILSGDTPRTHR